MLVAPADRQCGLTLVADERVHASARQRSRIQEQGGRVGLSFQDPRKRPLVMAGLLAYEAVTNCGRLVPSLNALGCRLHFADFGEKNGDK